MSDQPKADNGLRQSEDDEADGIPRLGILSAIPKRTFSRVVLLLAALLAIIYLRQRTSSIASWMSAAFIIPPSAQQKGASSSIKGRVVLPPEPTQKTR